MVTAADLAGQVDPIRADARFPNFHSAAWPILAGDVVRYQGELIAAVVAASPYLAADAAALVDVAYEPLPVVASIPKALAAEALLIHPA
ncbi:MAG: hypothetical protein U0031_11695 [Thermomicrobiales bacterium]